MAPPDVPAALARLCSAARTVVQALQPGAALVPFSRTTPKAGGLLLLEAGVLSADTVVVSPPFVAEELPAGEVALATYRGRHAGIPVARAELLAWIRAQERTAAGPGHLEYVAQPDGSIDAATCECRIVVPLAA